MRQMVDRGWDILVGGEPLSHFGELLHEGWQFKKTLGNSVSNDEIDRMYQRGREAGALGGKLLGAGGGGFLLFFAPQELHTELAKAFSDQHCLIVKINAPGSQVIFS